MNISHFYNVLKPEVAQMLYTINALLMNTPHGFPNASSLKQVFQQAKIIFWHLRLALSAFMRDYLDR